jgi:acetolactate synthase-1/2/3 large subunit
VASVIEEFLNFPGPAFLEVIIDPDAGVYPMVGPGLGYDAMITGEYIVARSQAPESAEVDPSGMF